MYWGAFSLESLPAMALSILLWVSFLLPSFVIRDVTPVVANAPLCSGGYYGAFYTEVAGVERLYFQGGPLPPEGFPFPYGHPERMADKIWVADRTPYGWAPPRLIIGADFFPWMGPDASPESYIGAVGTPTVFEWGGSYYMVINATIADPNICAAEHHGVTPYGGCVDPWSYFVVYLAHSPDGTSWSLVERPYGPKDTGNPALDAALLNLRPEEIDIEPDHPNGGYKGFGRVNAWVEGDQLYAYLFLWGTRQLKTGMVNLDMTRIGQPQRGWIWDSWWGRWENSVLDGEVPVWFNRNYDRGRLAGLHSQPTRILPYDGGYLATFSLPNDVHNRVGVMFSEDKLRWDGPMHRVESRVPYFADGTGYPLSIIDPALYRARHGWALYFSSAVNSEGTHKCPVPVSKEHPTAPFIGIDIYETLIPDPPGPRRRPVRHPPR